MKLELKNSLSVKLLRVVLLSALVVGVVLSCAQIVYDAYKTRQAVATDAERILDMFRDPSTQAVYSLDREMGMQVIEGLFQDKAVRMALALLEKLPKSQQLACTTFMEHFTALLGEQLLTDTRFQQQAHGEMLQLWLWHALEELEHKAVAFDVYELAGNRRLERIAAFPLVTLVMLPAVFASWGYLLAREGKLFDRRDLGKGLRMMLGRRGLIGRILPKMGLFARKDYHPARHDTRALESEWRERLFGARGSLSDQVRNLEEVRH